MSLPLPLPLLHPLGSPRKYRLKHRTALVALASLVAFTCYLLFVAYPSADLSKPLLVHVHDHDRAHVLGVIHPPDHPTAQQRAPPPSKMQQHLQPLSVARRPLAFSPAEELAALSAFIAALPHNVLPSSVDPNAPLDPQLVLDFDPRGETAREELTRIVEQVWARFPVMLYTKAHSSNSRELRYMLSNMHLGPTPLVVEADQREDADVLLPLLTRLTDVPSLPILLIGGRAVGAGAADTKGIMAEIRELHENGELGKMMLDAGATVEPRTGKGKGNKRRS